MILVTGANGFVGSALLTRLHAEGRPVVAGTRDGARGAAGVRSIALGDLSQPRDIRRELEGASCIVHTAARVHVLDERSVDPLAAFRQVNVDGTLNLARQAADAGVRRFVFVSSIKVNGESTRPGVPFTTQDPPRPEDPYGISKSEAELALRALASQRGIEVVIVRPPLVYGPGVRANFRALMRLLTLPVPLPFGAIDNRRSMVSVGNLVDFLVRCIDAPAAANATFLVSDDEDVSTSGLMRRLAGAMKKRPWLLPVSPPILIALGAVGGQSERMRRLCESLQVDISGTRHALAWAPPSTLEQGLFETAQWYLRETGR